MTLRWQIYGAILLRRLPELVPRMDPIETKVQEIFSAYEVALSKFSNHEMQHLEETKLKESDDNEVIIKETAQDKLDLWVKEKSEFKFADYNDRLAHTQYMFMKQKFSQSDNKERLLCPQLAYDSKLDSTLLDTARRALKEHLDITTGYKVIGKIPSSSYSFLFPKKLVDTIGYRGAKVFFMKAVLDGPNASVLEALDETKNKKLKWLTEKEAASSQVPSVYFEGLRKGLLYEDRVDVSKVYQMAASYASAIKAQKKSVEQ